MIARKMTCKGRLLGSRLEAAGDTGGRGDYWNLCVHDSTQQYRQYVAVRRRSEMMEVEKSERAEPRDWMREHQVRLFMPSQNEA